jgi:hypothetical protein
MLHLGLEDRSSPYVERFSWRKSRLIRRNLLAPGGIPQLRAASIKADRTTLCLTFALRRLKPDGGCDDPGAASMSYKTFTAICGRAAIILAFLLVIGIVAAPLLQRIWSPSEILAQR